MQKLADQDFVFIFHLVKSSSLDYTGRIKIANLHQQTLLIDALDIAITENKILVKSDTEIIRQLIRNVSFQATEPSMNFVTWLTQWEQTVKAVLLDSFSFL